MKTQHPLPYFLIIISGCLTLLLNIGCTKENLADDRPDFIFQGTLTEITDGTPKEGWTVYLREFVPFYQIPSGFWAPTSFGFDTISDSGRFSMDVNTFTDLNEHDSAGNSPEARRAYYSQHTLSFRAPEDFHGFNSDNPEHFFLDPDDVDLKLDEFDFSRRGEVITRDVKIFTGERANVTYRYLVERELAGVGTFSVKTSFRDFAFEKPFKTVYPNVFGPIEVGEQYVRQVELPVGRPMEAITSFRTITLGSDQNIVVLDSLIFQDTFLLQSLADTLQLRDYAY